MKRNKIDICLLCLNLCLTIQTPYLPDVFWGEEDVGTSGYNLHLQVFLSLSRWSLGIHTQEGLWLNVIERMQINVLSNILVAVTLRDLKVPSYNISKAVPIFLLGLNELLEMQNACQISRQPDWQIDSCTFII